MKIEFTGKNLIGALEADKAEMVCVSKRKYADVHLCFKGKNANITFADLNMNDGTYRDKESQFEALDQIGDKIADLWNREFKLGKYKEDPGLHNLVSSTEINPLPNYRIELEE